MSDGSDDEPRYRPGSRRAAARLAAVQAAYQLEMSSAVAASVVAEFRRHRLPRDAQVLDSALFSDIVLGVGERGLEIDGMIAGALRDGRSVDRLEVPLRAILRCGVSELLVRADVPGPVVVSEYVTIARGFFDPPGVALVNAVLDRLAHLLRDAPAPGDTLE